MTREELIELVRLMMAGAGETQEETDRLVDVLVDNVPHPGADDLIFYPEEAFGREPTAEEVVNHALSCKPIAL